MIGRTASWSSAGAVLPAARPDAGMGDDDVAAQRQFQPATDRVPVKQRHHRLGAAEDALVRAWHDRRTAAWPGRRHLLKVGASAGGDIAAAAYDQRPGLVVGRPPPDKIAQVGETIARVSAMRRSSALMISAQTGGCVALMSTTECSQRRRGRPAQPVRLDVRQPRRDLASEQLHRAERLRGWLAANVEPADDLVDAGPLVVLG
jgi:hypothetical protein